jgi:hypothetical protein
MLRARALELSACLLGLCVLHGCNTLDASRQPDTDEPAAMPEPLAADMIKACPDVENFKRSGARACTEIGCVNGLHLRVSPDAGWRAGAYRFDLELDGRPVTCEGALPLKPCGERSFTCDADGVALGESGCALPANAQGIAQIMVPGYPLQLSVRVSLNGAELANASFTPSYVSSQPNGPGCEPVCCGASANFTVSAAAQPGP